MCKGPHRQHVYSCSTITLSNNKESAFRRFTSLRGVESWSKLGKPPHYVSLTSQFRQFTRENTHRQEHFTGLEVSRTDSLHFNAAHGTTHCLNSSWVASDHASPLSKLYHPSFTGEDTTEGLGFAVSMLRSIQNPRIKRRWPHRTRGHQRIAYRIGGRRHPRCTECSTIP